MLHPAPGAFAPNAELWSVTRRGATQTAQMTGATNPQAAIAAGPSAFESNVPKPSKGKRSRFKEADDPPDGGDGSDSSSSDSDKDSYDSSSDSRSDSGDSGGRRKSRPRSRGRSRRRRSAEKDSKKGKKDKKSKKNKDGKEADALTLPEGFPTVYQLPRWKAQLLGCVCQCANRADERPVRKWLLKVEKPKMTFERLEKCPREFARLDRKHGAALARILKGELGRRVDVQQARTLRERQYLLSGRQMLFMMYESFRTDESMARCFTIHDLCSVRWLGDHQFGGIAKYMGGQIGKSDGAPVRRPTCLIPI